MLVFVYGTLMSGFRNNYLLYNSKFIGAANLVYTK
ncbi:gamma-glutamylcyclotransferase [Aliarcobacter cryaerophilus]